MNRRLFCVYGAAGTALAAGLTPIAGARTPLDEDDAAFEDAMSRTGRAFRRLRRALSDPEQTPAALEVLQAIQSGLLDAKAKLETVSMSTQAKSRYGENTADYHRDFRLKLIAAIAEALKVEQALLEGQPEKAAEAARRLRAVQQESHDMFQEQEGGERRRRGGAEGGRPPQG